MIDWVRVDWNDKCLYVGINGDEWCITEEQLEWLIFGEGVSVNYVYRVRKEDGNLEVMFGQYSVQVGDIMPSGEVVEVMGVYTDKQIGEMMAESLTKGSSRKSPKKWGKK